MKSVCAIALVIFSLFVYAGRPVGDASRTPIRWINSMNGIVFSEWNYVSGKVPGAVRYRSGMIADGVYYPYGEVIVNFAITGNAIYAEEVTVQTAFGYRGAIVGDQVIGSVSGIDNVTGLWIATLEYGLQE